MQLQRRSRIVSVAVTVSVDCVLRVRIIRLSLYCIGFASLIFISTGHGQKYLPKNFANF